MFCVKVLAQISEASQQTRQQLDASMQVLLILGEPGSAHNCFHAINFKKKAVN